MKSIPVTVLQTAFDLKDNEPLSKEHLDICDEWLSGKGEDLMKISTEDPKILGLRDFMINLI